MASSLAQNTIALLIDLAEQGEINPWDVQVIEVIDRVLSELIPANLTDPTQSARDADLSQSGQAFLYAAMLVLLKADSLARAEIPEGDPEDLVDIDLLDNDGLTEPRLPLHLERRLRRRAVAQPPQQRRVTLKELIDQLELMAVAVAEHSPRTHPRRPKPQSQRQVVRAIAQLAHQENLSEIAAGLEQFLTCYWSGIAQGRDWIEFDLLLELWADPLPPGLTNPSLPAQLSNDLSGLQKHNDRVGVFWALLFLSAQSKVELAQEEFYQDLKVRALVEPEAAALTEYLPYVLSD